VVVDGDGDGDGSGFAGEFVAVAVNHHVNVSTGRSSS